MDYDLQVVKGNNPFFPMLLSVMVLVTAMGSKLELGV